MKTKIKSYIHCKNCFSGRLEIGFFEKGMEVDCPDCENVVAVFETDFPIPKEYFECSCCKSGKHKICKDGKNNKKSR